MVSKITYTNSNNEIHIHGTNKMDYAWSIVIILVFGFTSMAILYEFKLWTTAVWTFFLMLIAFGSFGYSFRFSILINENFVIIKKTFFGIAYLTINQSFDTILYNDKIDFLSFQNSSNSVSIENHNGFEIDCLLVSKNNKNYEFGDKEDAELIFSLILKGIDELKLRKINSDIGLAQQIQTN